MTESVSQPSPVVVPLSDTVISLRVKYYVFSDTISPHSENSVQDVRRLQKFLNVYEENSLKLSGRYDKKTQFAVRRLQMKYAPEIYGRKHKKRPIVIDNYTRNLIHQIVAGKMGQ